MHFLARARASESGTWKKPIQGANSSGPILTRRLSSRFLAAKLLLFPRLHTACDPFEIFKPCTLAIRRAVQLAHKTARIAHFFYEFLQRQLGVEIGLPQAVDGDIAKQLVQFVHFALILRSFFAGPARLSLLAQSNLNQTIKPRRDALGAMDRPGRVEVNDFIGEGKKPASEL